MSNVNFMNTTDASVPVTAHYDASICDLDMALTIYDGDRDTIADLMNDETFNGIVNEINSEGETWNSRKHLLKSCLRLTRKMAPVIFEITDKCKKALGLNREIEVYVYQDQQFNAACYPPAADKVILMITSGIFEKFEPAEIEFVIGHELGHFIFGHNNFPAEMILERGHGHLAPIQAMKLYAWKRNAELTADRIGMICCQDFDAVGKAFFKLSSGVTVDSLAFQLDEYINQFNDLEDEMAGENVDPQDWYSTHPFSPLRLKALEFFRQSETYHKLIGQEGGSISEESMEDSIRRFMAMMEPSYLQETDEISLEAQKFMFLGGHMISAANGVIEDSEIESMKTLVTEDIFNAMIDEASKLTMDDYYDVIAPIAEKLRMHLPLVSRLNLIEQLSIVTYADGSIEDSEVEALYNLCHILHIDPSFADQVLHNATQSVD